MIWILLELLADIISLSSLCHRHWQVDPTDPHQQGRWRAGRSAGRNVHGTCHRVWGSFLHASTHRGWPCIVSGATLESYTWHSNRIFFILLIWLDVLGWWLKLLSDFLHGDDQTAPLFEHQATCLCLRPASRNNGGRFLVHSFQLLAHLIGEQ